MARQDLDISRIADNLSELQASIESAQQSYDESSDERLALDDIALTARCWQEREKTLQTLRSSPSDLGRSALESLRSLIQAGDIEIRALSSAAMSSKEMIDACERLDQVACGIGRSLDAYEDSIEMMQKIVETIGSVSSTRHIHARSVPDFEPVAMADTLPHRQLSLDDLELFEGRGGSRAMPSLPQATAAAAVENQTVFSFKIQQPESVASEGSGTLAQSGTLRSEGQSDTLRPTPIDQRRLSSSITVAWTDNSETAVSDSVDPTHKLFPVVSANQAALPDWRFYPLRMEESIRLLELLPCTDESEGIVCASKEVSLAYAPEFEMVSLEWGSAAVMKPLTINYGGMQHVYNVRATLYTALERLRYEDNRSRFLWLDMLCIDQNNLPERSAQVAMIPRIVGAAKQVCVWVGDRYGLSEEALRFVREHIGEFVSLTDAVAVGEHLQYWLALKALLKRPWFSRRWVVQEVVLARDATVYCGREWLKWDDFKAVVDFINKTSEKLSELARTEHYYVDPRLEFDEVPTLPGVKFIHVANRFFKRLPDQTVKPLATLQELMWHLQPLDTSYPPDVIYSLLALTIDTSPVSKDAPVILDGRRVTPKQVKLLRRLSRYMAHFAREDYELEYDQSLCSIFQRYIAFVIEHSPSDTALDVLCRPFVPDHTPYFAHLEAKEAHPLPSWMPRMSQAPFVKQVQRVDPTPTDIGSDAYYETYDEYTYERERGDPFVSAPGSKRYYTAAESKAAKTYFLARATHVSLFAEGFVLDEVEVVAETSQSGHIPRSWIDLSSHARTEFARTLTADRVSGTSNEFHKGAILSAIDKVPAHGSYNTPREIQNQKSAGLREVLKHVTATISGRCLIRTRYLQHFGLAPRGVQTGDLVCILYGCSVPIILRKGVEKLADDDVSSEVLQVLPEGSVMRRRVIAWARGARDARLGALTGSDIPGLRIPLVAEPLSMSDLAPSRRYMDVDQHSVAEMIGVQANGDTSARPGYHIGLPTALQQYWLQRLLSLSLMTVVLALFLGNWLLASFIWIICLPHMLLDHPRSRDLVHSIIRRYLQHTTSQESQGQPLLVATIIAAWLSLGILYATNSLTALITSTLVLSLFPNLLPNLDWTAAQSSGLQTVVTPRTDTSLQQTSAPAYTRTARHIDMLLSQRPISRMRRALSAASHRKKSFLKHDKDFYETQKYSFTMIGESYIDGMMYGEAIGIQNDSTPPRQDMLRPVTFEIR